MGVSELNHETIDARLADLLSGRPPGTTADLTDFAAAYWDGARVRYVFLHEDGGGALDEEFELTDYEIEQWRAELSAWLAAPRFTEARTEVLRWLVRFGPIATIPRHRLSASAGAAGSELALMSFRRLGTDLGMSAPRRSSGIQASRRIALAAE